MSRTMRYTVRFVVLVAFVAVILAVIDQGSSLQSPYGSALSNLSVDSALAAPRCQNKICDGNVPPKCLHSKGFNCPVQGNRCLVGAVC